MSFSRVNGCGRQKVLREANEHNYIYSINKFQCYIRFNLFNLSSIDTV